MLRSYGLSVKNNFEEIFSTGLFECVEYCRVDFRLPDQFENTYRDALVLAELSRKYNVAVRSYHLPFSDEGDFPFVPSSTDKELRDFTLENSKKLIQCLKQCGIEIVVIHGSLRVLPEERKARLDAFVDYICELCDFCESLGIKVAVESLKPACIGNCAEELLYIIDKAQKSNLGICFDSNHLLEQDNLQFIKKAGKYIITTHFSDFDGIDERHWYPGRGINDWGEIVRLLEENGYKGPWVFEVNFPGGKVAADEAAVLINEWENLFS